MPKYKEVNAIEIQSIASEIHTASQRLAKGVDALFILAKASAETEREYRNALAIEIVLLKSQGMSVTLIPDIARGNQANLKFLRDVAEFKYNSGKESLRAIQAQISALQTVIKYTAEI